jgi:hypothetical protein
LTGKSSAPRVSAATACSLAAVVMLLLARQVN